LTLTARSGVARFIPRPFRAALRAGAARTFGLARSAALAFATCPRDGVVRVWYGQRVPPLSEESHGGIVKFQHMQEVFPSSPRRFNVLYLVSSRPPTGALEIARTAKRKGARFVWNQDGVAYPAWAGPNWERANEPMGRLLRLADYVFYQSEFCRVGADRYLGRPGGGSEVLHNPVDTASFTPGASRPRGLVLLLGGTQYQRYRLETALHVIAAVRRRRPDATLLVTGRLVFLGSEPEGHRAAVSLATKLGVADAVSFLGPYTQAEAPEIFRRSHVLLHTKYNDPCPGVVLEAMACGLPVVYSASGGVPELVGVTAGIGIPAELSWERDLPPDPEAMATAVLAVANDLPRYADAARQRAVERFDLRRWLRRHEEVFESIV